MQYRLFRRVIPSLSSKQNKKCFKEGFSNIAIEALLTFEDPKFDSNGFIVDHNDVAKILETIAYSKAVLSCEVIARDSVKALITLDSIIEVEVKVYPDNKNTISFIKCISTP